MAESNRVERPDGGFAISKRNFTLVLAGFLVMVLGYILMTGGRAENPQEFNPEIFSIRRVVVAPVVVIAGIVLEIVAIMKVFKRK